MLQTMRRNWPAWLVLFLGAALRLWKLGDFPFHPDEAIHAWFALDLKNYHYDPVYHGPLLYHLVAGALAVCGVNDFSARLVPALFGVLLLWMVLFPTRKYLGERAALWSGALLALSPIIVTYSRHLLHDSLVLCLTLGAVLYFQAALEHSSSSHEGRVARLGLAAILSLFLATKANFFFIVAMLMAFWFLHFLIYRKRKATSLDYLTPIYCILVFIAFFVLLFRSDWLSALPAMIGYWGGQQKEPRLPGPNDYYLRLLLLYELPLFAAAIWGAWCAMTKRTVFTSLVLWWAITSCVLYAIANEKVPWLLAHQALPLALLGGYGLAQIEWKTLPRKLVFGTAVLIAFVFSARHVIATNWEEPVNHNEPLFFAQTTEAYRDTLFAALHNTRDMAAKGIWVAPDQQWPLAWYLREKAPRLEGSSVSWNLHPPDQNSLRLVIASEEEWKRLLWEGKFGGWKYVVVKRYIWPHPSRKAILPGVFWKFWMDRQASMDNGVLHDESSLYCVFAAPPHATIDNVFSSIP